MGFEKSDLINAAEILTVAIMMILVVLLVLQPMVSRLMAIERTSLDETLEADLLAAPPTNPALAPPSAMAGAGIPGVTYAQGIPESTFDDSMINIQGVEGKVKASTLKKVEEIVENYPAETVAVIRGWMTQES